MEISASRTVEINGASVTTEISMDLPDNEFASLDVPDTRVADCMANILDFFRKSEAQTAATASPKYIVNPPG